MMKGAGSPLNRVLLKMKAETIAITIPSRYIEKMTSPAFAAKKTPAKRT